MSDRSTKERGKEEAKIEGPQAFAEMCRRVMSGEMPDCCGAEMRERMSRWMAEFQAKGEK